MDRGAWRAAVLVVAKESDTMEQLSTWIFKEIKLLLSCGSFIP